MATTNDKYLLVSDSNEISSEYDSKKLNLDELVEIGQDKLFDKYLEMSNYLTNNYFSAYTGILYNKYSSLLARKPFPSWSGKFAVVDGQVILLKKSELPSGKTPLEYLNEHWNITSEFIVTEITNCMLRGITYKSDDTDVVRHSTGKSATLDETTVPPHMHQSGLTKNASIQKMDGSGQETLGDTSGLRYDMFHNDSFDTGLSRNELDGVVDKFTPQSAGSDNPTHNNLPKYDTYYAFLIRSASA